MSSKQLSQKNRKTLLIGINRDIEEVAENTAKSLLEETFNMEISYPPNGGFTNEEMEALNKVKEIEHIEGALRKLIANACSTPLFHLLNYIDGTGDPGEDWSGVALVDLDPNDDEDVDFLHDDFFDLYWEWRKMRPQKRWKLDVYEG